MSLETPDRPKQAGFFVQHLLALRGGELLGALEEGEHAASTSPQRVPMMSPRRE